MATGFGRQEELTYDCLIWLRITYRNSDEDGDEPPCFKFKVVPDDERISGIEIHQNDERNLTEQVASSSGTRTFGAVSREGMDMSFVNHSERTMFDDSGFMSMRVSEPPEQDESEGDEQEGEEEESPIISETGGRVRRFSDSETMFEQRSRGREQLAGFSIGRGRGRGKDDDYWKFKKSKIFLKLGERGSTQSMTEQGDMIPPELQNSWTQEKGQDGSIWILPKEFFGQPFPPTDSDSVSETGEEDDDVFLDAPEPSIVSETGGRFEQRSHDSHERELFGQLSPEERAKKLGFQTARIITIIGPSEGTQERTAGPTPPSISGFARGRARRLQDRASGVTAEGIIPSDLQDRWTQERSQDGSIWVFPKQFFGQSFLSRDQGESHVEEDFQDAQEDIEVEESDEDTFEDTPEFRRTDITSLRFPGRAVREDLETIERIDINQLRPEIQESFNQEIIRCGVWLLPKTFFGQPLDPQDLAERETSSETGDQGTQPLDQSGTNFIPRELRHRWVQEQSSCGTWILPLHLVRSQQRMSSGARTGQTISSQTRYRSQSDQLTQVERAKGFPRVRRFSDSETRFEQRSRERETSGQLSSEERAKKLGFQTAKIITIIGPSEGTQESTAGPTPPSISGFARGRARRLQDRASGVTAEGIIPSDLQDRWAQERSQDGSIWVIPKQFFGQSFLPRDQGESQVEDDFQDTQEDIEEEESDEDAYEDTPEFRRTDITSLRFPGRAERTAGPTPTSISGFARGRARRLQDRASSVTADDIISSDLQDRWAQEMSQDGSIWILPKTFFGQSFLPRDQSEGQFEDEVEDDFQDAQEDLPQLMSGRDELSFSGFGRGRARLRASRATEDFLSNLGSEIQNNWNQVTTEDGVWIFPKTFFGQSFGSPDMSQIQPIEPPEPEDQTEEEDIEEKQEQIAPGQRETGLPPPRPSMYDESGYISHSYISESDLKEGVTGPSEESQRKSREVTSFGTQSIGRGARLQGRARDLSQSMSGRDESSFSRFARGRARRLQDRASGVTAEGIIPSDLQDRWAQERSQDGSIWVIPKQFFGQSFLPRDHGEGQIEETQSESSETSTTSGIQSEGRGARLQRTARDLSQLMSGRDESSFSGFARGRARRLQDRVSGVTAGGIIPSGLQDRWTQESSQDGSIWIFPKTFFGQSFGSQDMGGREITSGTGGQGTQTFDPSGTNFIPPELRHRWVQEQSSCGTWILPSHLVRSKQRMSSEDRTGQTISSQTQIDTSRAQSRDILGQLSGDASANWQQEITPQGTWIFPRTLFGQPFPSKATEESVSEDRAQGEEQLSDWGRRMLQRIRESRLSTSLPAGLDHSTPYKDVSKQFESGKRSKRRVSWADQVKVEGQEQSIQDEGQEDKREPFTAFDEEGGVIPPIETPEPEDQTEEEVVERRGSISAGQRGTVLPPTRPQTYDESGYISHSFISESDLKEVIEDAQGQVQRETETPSSLGSSRWQRLSSRIHAIRDRETTDEDLTRDGGMSSPVRSGAGIGRSQRIQMMADSLRRRHYMNFGTEELSPGNYLTIDLQHDWAQEQGSCGTWIYPKRLFRTQLFDEHQGDQDDDQDDQDGQDASFEDDVFEGGEDQMSRSSSSSGDSDGGRGRPGLRGIADRLSESMSRRGESQFSFRFMSGRGRGWGRGRGRGIATNLTDERNESGQSTGERLAHLLVSEDDQDNAIFINQLNVWVDNMNMRTDNLNLRTEDSELLFHERPGLE